MFKFDYDSYDQSIDKNLIKFFSSILDESYFRSSVVDKPNIKIFI
jgi:hypothetical protein